MDDELEFYEGFLTPGPLPSHNDLGPMFESNASGHYAIWNWHLPAVYWQMERLPDRPPVIGDGPR